MTNKRQLCRTARAVFVFLTMAVGVWAQSDKASPALYQLGPDDVVSINVLDVEELTNKAVRVNMRGDITLPLVGSLHVGGLTSEQVQSQLKDRLRTYIQSPDVSVTVTDFHSQPVSVLGAVNQPGVVQLQGNKNLLQILSLAGGVRNDASNMINITRRKEWGPIPLPNAKPDPTGQFSIAAVNFQSLVDATKPEENISVQPYDVISVPKSDLVYVVGEVGHAGGFMLTNNNGNISVLQAVALAGGVNKTAKSKEAKVLRQIPGATERREIPLNLKAMLDGKVPDFPLQKEDILFVPNSTGKTIANEAIQAMISGSMGAVMIGIPH